LRGAVTRSPTANAMVGVVVALGHRHEVVDADQTVAFRKFSR